MAEPEEQYDLGGVVTRWIVTTDFNERFDSLAGQLRELSKKSDRNPDVVLEQIVGRKLKERQHSGTNTHSGTSTTEFVGEAVAYILDALMKDAREAFVSMEGKPNDELAFRRATQIYAVVMEDIRRAPAVASYPANRTFPASPHLTRKLEEYLALRNPQSDAAYPTQ